MFKRSLLSLVLVAGLVCSVADAAWDMTSAQDACNSAFNSVSSNLSSAKTLALTKATECASFVASNKYQVAAGVASVAALTVFAYYAYKYASAAYVKSAN